MPELPEVEAQRRMLEAHVVGQRIDAVVLTEQGGGPRSGTFDDKVFGEGVQPGEFATAVQGAYVLAARRRGKQLWMELSREASGPPTACLLVHLGMTGSLLVRGVEVHGPEPSERCTAPSPLRGARPRAQ
jgi:formamidopyrimidine-DNA glycosylase